MADLYDKSNFPICKKELEIVPFASSEAETVKFSRFASIGGDRKLRNPGGRWGIQWLEFQK
jgi:hypothetical protein